MTHLRENDLFELIGLIYDAAEQPERWAAFLSRFAGLFNSHFVELELIGSEFAIPASVGIDDSDRRALAEYYWRVNPWAEPAKAAKPGEVEASHLLVPDAQYRESEYFRDFGKRIGQYYGLGGIVLASSSTVGLFGVVRDNLAGPCTADEIDFVKQLVPHIARSLRINDQVARLRGEARSILECLDQLGRGVVVLDGSGRILQVSRVAEQMAGQRDGLYVSRASGLRASRDSETIALRKLIHDASQTASGNGRSSGGTIAISRPSQRRPWIAVVSPHRTESGEGLAAVLLIDSDGQQEPNPQVVSRLFAFTPAETRLALLLAAGIRLEDAATHLSITMNTARTHTRRILDKAGLRRQTDLVLLLNKLPSKTTR